MNFHFIIGNVNSSFTYSILVENVISNLYQFTLLYIFDWDSLVAFLSSPSPKLHLYFAFLALSNKNITVAEYVSALDILLKKSIYIYKCDIHLCFRSNDFLIFFTFPFEEVKCACLKSVIILLSFMSGFSPKYIRHWNNTVY